MPGFKGAERENHHERCAGEIGNALPTSARRGQEWAGLSSVEIRAAQVEAALRALQLAAVVHHLRRTIRTEAAQISGGLSTLFRGGNTIAFRALAGISAHNA